MKLISVEKFISDIEDFYHGCYSEVQIAPYQLCNVLSERKPDYDVDRVVKKLKGLIKANHNANALQCEGLECKGNDCIDCMIMQAIDIVKSGGV